jgi:hypothetical protein
MASNKPSGKAAMIALPGGRHVCIKGKESFVHCAIYFRSWDSHENAIPASGFFA